MTLNIHYMDYMNVIQYDIRISPFEALPQNVLVGISSVSSPRSDCHYDLIKLRAQNIAINKWLDYIAALKTQQVILQSREERCARPKKAAPFPVALVILCSEVTTYF